MNKIDEIIQKWGNREEAYRLYRLVLFDYYLTRYFELTERKLDGIKHHGINDKALINLLFVCLNSVEKESCGLFEAFRNFKIVCGWSRRILTVSQPDVERLFVLIPEHRSNNGKWEKRPAGQRTKIWTALGEKSIADYITSTGRKISQSTVSDYVEALCEAFIFYPALRFDIGGKELMKTNQKYYIVDLGLRRHLIAKHSYDLGFSLENLVYLELLRRGYDVNVGKVGNTEVDFVAKKDDRYYYFQVTDNMTSESTFNREITPLQNIPDNYPKTILTNDRLTLGNYNGIEVVNVIDWLLE